MAKKADGSTALAAVVGYLVFKAVGDAMSPFVLGLPNEGAEQALDQLRRPRRHRDGPDRGATCGSSYHRITLPPYLAFFGGRRFVPIITAFAALVPRRCCMSFVYPAFNDGPDQPRHLGHEQLRHRRVRLRHPEPPADPARPAPHPEQPGPWFIIGSYDGLRRRVVHGDIARFLAGDPTAGAFMTGFFPIMMFALPGRRPGDLARGRAPRTARPSAASCCPPR